MYYVNIFFIYSFLGFLFENFLDIFLKTDFNSGILAGPWTFIYAIAIFVIMIFNKFLKQFKLNKFLEVLIFYIVITIFMTLIEFSGGMLIEKLFHQVYWDYTNLKFNYGHYISLEISLLWGLFATLVNYFLASRINKLATKIPTLLSLILIVLFVIDFLFLIF